MLFAYQSKFRDRHLHNKQITGLLAFQGDSRIPALTDGHDLVLLVIAEREQSNDGIYHYIEEDCRIQERWIARKRFEDLIYRGANRNMMQWILQGEILLDREAYLGNFQHMLLEFPELLKEQRLLSEFSLFLKCYLQSKGYLRENHLLDAFNNILEALHHWARLAIIEQGIHAEVTVWEQIRSINPGVHKLYEELTTSTETLELRIQLVLLACEFSAASKLEKCCGAILRILDTDDRLWSVKEIGSHPVLKENSVNLSLLLNKLVKKSLVREVAVPITEDLSLLELRYTR